MEEYMESELSGIFWSPKNAWILEDPFYAYEG